MKSALVVLVATVAMVATLAPSTIDVIKGSSNVTIGPNSMLQDANGFIVPPTDHKESKHAKKGSKKHREHHDD